MARLAQDVQSVVELAKANPAMEGLFQALLLLLENAPDSSIVAEALTQIDPAACANAEHRQKAAELLMRGERPDLAQAWLPRPEAPPADNVVSLWGATPQRATPGDSLTFADIGGLEPVKEQVRRKIIKPFQTPT